MLNRFTSFIGEIIRSLKSFFTGIDSNEPEVNTPEGNEGYNGTDRNIQQVLGAATGIIATLIAWPLIYLLAMLISSFVSVVTFMVVVLCITLGLCYLGMELF